MERDMIKISSAKSETKYIAHHGTEGMHWGKRKYQYEDGSLTPLGRIHYGVGEARERSKIKMREARDAAKNEARVIKAQAKADAMKYKAEAKAYKAKKDAEEETERRRIEADKEMERNFGKEKTKQTQIEADARVEMNRQQYEPQQVKEKNYTALKVAGGLLAAAGIGYLLYKTFKSGSGGGSNQTFSKEVASKGEDTIKKLENSPASEIAKKGDEAVKSGGKSLGFFAKRKAEKQSGKDFGNAALERLEKANRNAEVAKKVENANRLVKNDAINEMRRMADANATSAANQTKASRVLKSNFTRMVNKSNKGGIKGQPWGNKPAGLENFGSFLKDYRKKHGTVFTARHSEELMEGYVLVHSANPDVCHWGILGQKWGVRRYQNPDGTLTELGRQHYGRKDVKNFNKASKKNMGYTALQKKASESKIVKDFKNNSDEYADLNKHYEALKALGDNVTKEQADEFLDHTRSVRKAAAEYIEQYSDYQAGVMANFAWGKENDRAYEIRKQSESKNAKEAIKELREAELFDEQMYSTNKERGDKAADLGLKALQKLGRLSENPGDDELRPGDKVSRDWFVYEDQTIGLATIADMVNRGKTKDQILKALNNAFKYNNFDQAEIDGTAGVFQLANSGFEYNMDKGERFIDACIAVKKEEENKRR